jgi:hypothetical protein
VVTFVDDECTVFTGGFCIEVGLARVVLGEDVAAFGEDFVTIVASHLFSFDVSLLFEVVGVLVGAVEHENYNSSQVKL